MTLTDLIEPVEALCRDAGAAILDVYESDFDVQEKDDQSPLTRADLAAHRILSDGLNALSPELPLISEEGGLPTFEERGAWPRYWLIDPLDGTREFVNRNGEFTVNVALIDDHRPVFGAVYVPVTGVGYIGCKDHGAERRNADGSRERLAVAVESRSPVRVVGSRSHRGESLNGFLEQIGEHEMLPVGSSLKFCQVAEGTADVYPRLGPTSEWDTAAAQAVVEQAGGRVVEVSGEPLLYNRKADILNPFFLVIGPDDHDWVGIAQEVV